MWLMNKSASLQLEHFNKSNALSWALTMGLFAMPVVYTWYNTFGWYGFERDPLIPFST